VETREFSHKSREKVELGWHKKPGKRSWVEVNEEGRIRQQQIRVETVLRRMERQERADRAPPPLV
jgi:hypothetical protein